MLAARGSLVELFSELSQLRTGAIVRRANHRTGEGGGGHEFGLGAVRQKKSGIWVVFPHSQVFTARQRETGKVCGHDNRLHTTVRVHDTIALSRYVLPIHAATMPSAGSVVRVPHAPRVSQSDAIFAASRLDGFPETRHDGFAASRHDGFLAFSLSLSLSLPLSPSEELCPVRACLHPSCDNPCPCRGDLSSRTPRSQCFDRSTHSPACRFHVTPASVCRFVNSDITRCKGVSRATSQTQTRPRAMHATAVSACVQRTRIWG